MCSLGMGFILIAFGILVVGSPVWLLKEIQREADDDLPEWMGSARARKRRLLWIFGILCAVIGTGLVVLSLANP